MADSPGGSGEEPDKSSLNNGDIQHEENEGRDSRCRGESRNSSEKPPKTTTISTIAVQSGNTRLVIALLQSGEWLELKVLEVQPSLTKLGSTVEEATELLYAHNEVLVQLQNKQSPVEELLRQADQLISTQKPRAEVYAAMADTLGQAWRDVNSHLERRKQILDSNVLFQSRAEEYRESMKALEMACNDTLLPIEIDAVKNFLTKIHDLRKSMLESLMNALQEGKTLLDLLREIANEGTLDSRPDFIKVEADQAILQVEKWLEALHDKRKLIEISFQCRKTQLEQCLALALLATDLRDLEEILNDRIAALASSSDQLGDSSASAELLLFELKKLQPEAKDFQDKGIKITKSTEQLVSSGHFAGEQATEQAYAILSACADYINDLEQYETMLNKAIAFFRSAQSALTKLDQLEIQLITTEHPAHSSQLVQLHAQSAAALEEVTAQPLSEGYALLDVTGRGAPGAEGVKRVVEDLENRKIQLTNQCTAHNEQNLAISQALTTFLETHNELYSWLVSIAEAFLQGHQDMGSNLPMARDFYDLHYQLLSDLQNKGEEINAALNTLPPVIEYLDEIQRRDVDQKVDDLHNHWLKLKNLVDARIELGSIYVKFHTVVSELASEIDSVEEELRKTSPEGTDQDMVKRLEKKWMALQPLYLQLTASGKHFLDASRNIVDPYLDIPRTCLCVETILEQFANRQLIVTESWESWQSTLTIIEELRIQREKIIDQSGQTLTSISKLEGEIYPVITSDSPKASDILKDLEVSRTTIRSDLSKAALELDNRIKNVDVLSQKDNSPLTAEIRRKLSDVHENLQRTTTEYQILVEMLISIFKSIDEVTIHRERVDEQLRTSSLPKSVAEVESLIVHHDARRESVSEILKFINSETDYAIQRIGQQEPKDAGEQDVEKLKHFLESEKSSWEKSWSARKSQLDEQLQLAQFDADLAKINGNIDELSRQLSAVKGKYGENLPAAKSTSDSFVQFEKTITILEERIETFIRTTTETITETYTLAPEVRKELSDLKEKWIELRNKASETRRCADLSVEYFKLLEEAEEWFRDGSKLLVTIARKATSVKVPEDAVDLLRDVDTYLKPGEEKQEKRIEKIRELSIEVFGTERLPQFSKVIVENREMLDSFSIVTSELQTLVQNLKNAEDLRDKLKKEQEEADAKLNAARAETLAAQAAAAEAENARHVAEVMAARTVEKAAGEARRLAEVELERAKQAQIERQKAQTPVSTQTDAPPETKDSKDSTDEIGTQIIEETTTSHDTLITKEIHILQKTELQQAIPLPPRAATPQRETSPAKVPKVEEDVPEPIPPQFIVPLNNATIQEGERLTFECRLIGFPVPEVIWYKDSISILNNPDYQTTYDQGICTLTIEETFAEDSAQFVCKAFNSVGSAETVATLTVKETSPEEQLSAPEFTRKLLPSFATEGTSHSLECTVEGNPLPTVQWFKNESNIDNSPDYVITYNNGEAVLKFEEVFVEDQATYTCKATNQVGQASTSASLCVKISSPTEVPSFVTPLSNVMARTGQKVKLECEVRGIPPPNVSWTHDGKFVKETPDLKIETEGGKSTLIISEAFPKDAGTYAVSARNIAGEATSSSNVSVKGRIPNETSDSETNYDVEPIKPRIQLPLGDIEVSEGQSVRLDCIIVGQPEPEVIWYHDGEPVKESADFQLLFQGDRCTLIIHEAFFDDAGNYKVVAINSGGEASSECVLSVVPVTPEADVDPKTQVEVVEAGSPPRFTKLLTDVLVAEGEKTTFECAVKGSPEPELKWYLNNNEIKPNERVQITEGEYGSRVLEISPTLPEDKGNYIAKATNPLGEAKAFAHLIVKSLGDLLQKSEELVQMEEKLVAPAFKEIFSNTSVHVGNTTKFECIVTGKPTPKIQWLFNGQPVCGKGFLVSVSGDRQVLTVPEAQEDQNGTVSCVAENIAGKATCTASLEVGGGAIGVDLELTTVIRTPVDEMQSASSSEKHFTTEMSKEGGSQSILTKMSSTVTQSSHTSSLKEFSSSTTSSSTALGQQPTSVCVKTTKQSSEHSHSENGGPPVVQSHKVEEYERIFQDKPGEIRQEKTVIVSKDEDLQKDSKVIVHKPTRKNVAPRFISPVTGMIVDQGADVILEGILDGFPSPNVTWLKNGQELKARDGVQINYAHNHARVELKAVNVKDAGRYTCTATNDVGTASSTADLVVKKTVFPPVFGRRLQAQVVKRGDRVIMEVEITGSPEPTVTWYKNDLVMREQSPGIRLKNQGNCYSLIIERAAKEDAGKYMVRATNAGGEAQSIADFAVFEPTPDTMVEVHKTVVYENVKEQGIVQPGKVGVETPSANLTAQHVSTTTIQPSSGLLGLAPSLPVSSGSSVRTTQVVETTQPSSESRTTRSETFSSTIESHQSETKSEQKFHMTLEHKTPPIFETERKLTTVQQQTPEITSSSTTTVKEVIQNSGPGEQFQEIIENENVETSTIAKKDALSFFESKSKETETLPRGPKEMIKLPQEEGTSGYDVKVNKLTKNYERTTKFEEIKKPEYTSEFQTSKKAVQEIFTKLERGSAARGIDNSLIEFPYEGYKLPPLEIKQTVLEDTTASGSPIHGALTISKLQAQSESAEAMMSGFNLIPEPPPEIGYMPKVETAKKKRPDISVKVRQLEESHKNLSPIEAPIGGVRIFPSPVPKFEPKIETPKTPRPPSTYIPPPFELGKKEVVDEICVKKTVQQGKSEDYLVKREVVVESPVSVPIAPQATPKKAKTPERSEVSPVPFAPTDTSYTSDFETRSHISTDLSEYRCHSVASSGQLERPSSPKPSADGIAMEKSWARKHAESSKKSWPPQQEQHHVYSQKQWAPGQDYKSSSHETSREVKESPQGGITTTNIESSTSVENKSWSTREERLYKSVAEPLPPKPIIYNAETIKVDHKVHPVDETSVTERYSSECNVRKTESIEKTIIEEHGVKPSAINKSWPPGLAQSEELKAPQLVKNFAPKPVVQSYHSTEPVLEPGPPPEIGFVPGPVTRENKVERIERTLEMNLEHTPTKVPPGGVRMFPPAPKIPEPSAPPIPPKDAYVPPPPLPAKSSQPFQRFPDLDPFPYQADSPGTGFAKPPPPPTPSKFVKGEFAGSDYESDLESSSRSKWRAYESDNDAPRYRRVKAPVSKQPVRPKSTEPEPLPPSSFEVPSSDLTGPPRPTLVRDYQEKSSKKTMTRHERDMKHQQYVQPTPWVQPQPDIQPSSPPIYVQPKSPKTPPILAPKSPTKIKPESPKFKVKTFQKAESGYMADTDEPFHQQSSSTVHKSFSKHEGSSSHSESHTSYSESHSHVIKSQAFASLQQKKEVNNYSNVQPQVQQQRSSFVERTTTCNGGTEDAGFARFNPAKETVYTINQSGQQQYQHKQETNHQGHFSSEPIPVKVIQGKPQQQQPQHQQQPATSAPPPPPPHVFDNPPSYSGPPRPEFKPLDRSAVTVKVTKAAKQIEKNQQIIQKPTPISPVPQQKLELVIATPSKPKSVLLPGSPPVLGYAPSSGNNGHHHQHQTFYEGRAGAPYHNAVGTETKKTVRMDESTESTRRIVTVEQTSRVIKFGDNSSQQKNNYPHKGRQNSVPTPTKFVQGQFRESDYESDADIRIKPKWAPADSDTEDLHYRKVQPPRAVRCSSVPVQRERVATPMEFDTQPPLMPQETSFAQHLIDVTAENKRLQRVEEMRKRFDSQTKISRQRSYDSTQNRDVVLKPGSPPEFGYVSKNDFKQAANSMASKHMSDMTSSFKSKTEKFVRDIATDLKKKPILKHAADERSVDTTDDPQAYREESRLAEHGTKHIDPDTGLIYFKYDFGYEFGVLLPGEGKKTVSSASKSIRGQRRASDIDVPIIHEFTTKKENGFSKSPGREGSGKFPNSKTVKWGEPTSESEFSEAEETRSKIRRGNSVYNNFHAPSVSIPQSTRWLGENATPSPVSLSPSLPSLSPHQSSLSAGPPSNVDSAGSPWPTNGGPATKEIIQPYLDIQPKKAPLFITPLRDIAVVSGQTARFECIVQAEPPPNILWSKDGRIIENSGNNEIQYRNGVCRLSIPRAYPEDAGGYSCTATNSLGSTSTSASLLVPGNRRSLYNTK